MTISQTRIEDGKRLLSAAVKSMMAGNGSLSKVTDPFAVVLVASFEGHNETTKKDRWRLDVVPREGAPDDIVAIPANLIACMVAIAGKTKTFGVEVDRSSLL